MNVIWYNTIKKRYEFGSLEDYQTKQASCFYPDQILALEEFFAASTHTLMKITSELNKCQFSK